MRHIYLIARREYLSYVATVGFWISLGLVPIFMAAGFTIPALIERAQPTAYFAVIADEPALAAAIDQRMAEERRDRWRQAIGALARVRGDRAAALKAFDAAAPGEEVAAAVAALGLPGEAAAGLEVARAKQVRVPAPATTPEALRPYLMGDKTIDTPEGPRALHAAAFLTRKADGGVAIDYWSANLTETELLALIRSAVRAEMREAALTAAGVSAEAVRDADKLSPTVTELTPERAATEAEVTLSDRMPYLVATMLGIGLWVVIFSVVNMLLTSTIEEKANKILETLLSTARLYEILTGKLLGVALVSATLLSVWGLAGLAVMAAARNAGGGLPPEMMSAVLDPGLLIPFAGYFIVGYLMYGSIFLAVGSLCETIQEAQTLMSPMIILLMGPMLVLPMALNAPNSPVVTAVSWVPLYTPFVMLIRLPSEPAFLEVLGTTVLTLATTIGVLWAAGGIFRAGVVGRAGPDAVKKAVIRLFRRPKAA